MKSPSEALTDISDIEDPDFCNAINGTHPEDGTAPPPLATIRNPPKV